VRSRAPLPAARVLALRSVPASFVSNCAQLSALRRLAVVSIPVSLCLPMIACDGALSSIRALVVAAFRFNSLSRLYCCTILYHAQVVANPAFALSPTGNTATVDLLSTLLNGSYVVRLDDGALTDFVVSWRAASSGSVVLGCCLRHVALCLRVECL
jgi:hypothetical protein